MDAELWKLLLNSGSGIALVAIYALWIQPQILKAFKVEMARMRKEHTAHFRLMLRRATGKHEILIQRLNELPCQRFIHAQVQADSRSPGRTGLDIVSDRPDHPAG